MRHTMEIVIVMVFTVARCRCSINSSTVLLMAKGQNEWMCLITPAVRRARIWVAANDLDTIRKTAPLFICHGTSTGTSTSAMEKPSHKAKSNERKTNKTKLWILMKPRFFLCRKFSMVCALHEKKYMSERDNEIRCPPSSVLNRIVEWLRPHTIIMLEIYEVACRLD